MNKDGWGGISNEGWGLLEGDGIGVDMGGYAIDINPIRL